MPRDIKQNQGGDWQLVNNHVAFGESTNQHQMDILLARVGDFKNAPTKTIGIADYLDADDPDDLNQQIRTKFAADGMEINYITLNNGKLDIDADYNNG